MAKCPVCVSCMLLLVCQLKVLSVPKAGFDGAPLRLVDVEGVGPARCQRTGIRLPIQNQELREDRCPLVLKKAGIEVVRHPLRMLLSLAFKRLAQCFFEGLLRRVPTQYLLYTPPELIC